MNQHKLSPHLQRIGLATIVHISQQINDNTLDVYSTYIESFIVLTSVVTSELESRWMYC